MTLYRVLPMDENVRPLYVLASGPEQAVREAIYFIPRIRSVTAVADEGYVGEAFPRFIGPQD